MNHVTTLEAYDDDRGNRIEFSGSVDKNIRVKFKGRNNVLRVASQQNIAQLFVDFDCDDGHPIFDVRTGKRVNAARSIVIGNHVWLGLGACVLGGVTIGDGTVVGMRSVVTRSLPNNVVGAGSPAKVVKRNVAWERPHLTLDPPYRKPTVASVKKSTDYWTLTVDPGSTPSRSREIYAGARRRTRRRLKAVRARADALTRRA